MEIDPPGQRGLITWNVSEWINSCWDKVNPRRAIGKNPLSMISSDYKETTAFSHSCGNQQMS